MENLLSRRLICPLSWNEASALNRTSVGSTSPWITPWNSQLTKFSLASPRDAEFVNHSTLTLVQLARDFCVFSYCAECNLFLENFSSTSKLSEFERHFCSNLSPYVVDRRKFALLLMTNKLSGKQHGREPAIGLEWKISDLTESDSRLRSYKIMAVYYLISFNIRGIHILCGCNGVVVEPRINSLLIPSYFYTESKSVPFV
jgi:hypothetical protein